MLRAELSQKLLEEVRFHLGPKGDGSREGVEGLMGAREYREGKVWHVHESVDRPAHFRVRILWLGVVEMKSREKE